MANIIITLDLNDGELKAYQAELAAYNAANGTTLTAAEYGAMKLKADASAGKLRAIDAKAQAIADASKALPDDRRDEFTDAVEALFQQISTRP